MARKRRENGEGTGVYPHSNGGFYAKVSLGCDIHGKRIRLNIYGATRQDVQSKRNDALSKHARGFNVAPEKLTLGEMLEVWLEGRKPHIAETTHTIYAHRVNKWIPVALKSKRLQAVRKADILDYLTYLADLRISTGEKSKVLEHLRAALETAIDRDYISLNPARGVKVQVTATTAARGRKQTQTALTLTERDRFLDIARGDALYPLLYVLFSLALRRGEALGLRWTDINFETGSVRIAQQVRVQGSKPVIAPVKTQNSARVLQASTDLLEVFTARRLEQKHHRETLRDSWHENGLVFTTSLGTPIHPRNVNRTIKRLCAAGGLRHFASHTGRKTVLTDMLRSGVSLPTVSRVAGHSRPSITSDMYIHVFDEDIKAAVYSVLQTRENRPRAEA